MKNFHAYNIFFRHVVDAYIIILLIEITNHKGIDEFKAWVAQSDWPCFIEKIQKLYLKPFYIQSFWAKNKQEGKLVIDIILMGQKKE